jgi:hypothetical protein
MSPERIVFKEPIVRAETQRMRFPDICPVCGDPAEDLMPIIIIPNQYKSLRPSLDYGSSYYGRKLGSSPTSVKKIFQIPVCATHHYTDEGAGQYKSYCIVFDGLALVYLILSLLTFGNQFWSGNSPSLWVVFAAAIFATFLIITYALFRPGPIEDAVKIIGFDGGFSHVWIQFKRAQYRDEFMKENAMTAELVTWIQRT